MAAMLEEGSGAHEMFSRKMVPFHAAAEREFAAVEVCGGVPLHMCVMRHPSPRVGHLGTGI